MQLAKFISDVGDIPPPRPEDGVFIGFIALKPNILVATDAVSFFYAAKIDGAAFTQDVEVPTVLSFCDIGSLCGGDTPSFSDNGDVPLADSYTVFSERPDAVKMIRTLVDASEGIQVALKRTSVGKVITEGKGFKFAPNAAGIPMLTVDGQESAAPPVLSDFACSVEQAPVAPRSLRNEYRKATLISVGIDVRTGVLNVSDLPKGWGWCYGIITRPELLSTGTDSLPNVGDVDPLRPEEKYIKSKPLFEDIEPLVKPPVEVKPAEVVVPPKAPVSTMRWRQPTPEAQSAEEIYNEQVKQEALVEKAKARQAEPVVEVHAEPEVVQPVEPIVLPPKVKLSRIRAAAPTQPDLFEAGSLADDTAVMPGSSTASLTYNMRLLSTGLKHRAEELRTFADRIEELIGFTNACDNVAAELASMQAEVTDLHARLAAVKAALQDPK